MNFYSYDRVTGVYAGGGAAEEYPREPGKFLLPAFATFSAPPPTMRGEMAVFRDDKWYLAMIPVKIRTRSERIRIAASNVLYAISKWLVKGL